MPKILTFLRDIAGQGGATIAGMWESIGVSLGDSIKRQLAAHPTLPLAAAVRKDRPDLSNSLERMQMPLLIYAGDKDFRYEGVKQCGLELRNAQFVSIPDLDHLLGFTRSDLVIPRIRAFLDQQSAQPASV